MDANWLTALIGLGFLVVVGLLAWRFDVTTFSLRVPGFEGKAEAKKTSGEISKPPPSANAAGPGSVAIGGDAHSAEIETNVTGGVPPSSPQDPQPNRVTASGPGAVAIGGGADGAKISTKVTKPNDA